MFGIVLTYTGDCCQQTPELPRYVSHAAQSESSVDDVFAGGCTCSSAANHSSSHHGISRFTGRAIGRDPVTSQCISQTCRDVRWSGPHRCRLYATKRNRVCRPYTEFLGMHAERPCSCSPADDRLATQKALQTVAAGQQAENLLDFSDDVPNEGQPSGLAATTVLASTPAAANLLAGTSSNPLDDLVSIFGSANLGATSSPAPANPMGGFGFGASPLTPAPAVTPVMSPQPPAQPQAQSGQEDLLGLF